MHSSSMLATAFLVLAACSGPTKPVVTPNPANAIDAGAPAPDSAPAAPGLSQDDCEEVLENVFRLVFAHRTANLPPEAQPTPEDVEVAKAKLREDLHGDCIGASKEAFGYDCVMSAANMDELAACLSQPGAAN